MKNILFETIIGSHLWKMNDQDSDIDIFQVYVTPTKDILKGVGNLNSRHIFEESESNSLYNYPYNRIIDITSHEIGKVIGQLIKGNINFLLGVLSPMTVNSSSWLEKLRELVVDNKNKLCYHSIRGLATHNYEKYIKSGKDTSVDRCIKIGRYLNFGCTLFTTGEYEFEPPIFCAHPFEIEYWISKLDRTYSASTLPTSVNEEEFRNLLLEIRLEYLEK